ncbi:LamG domain-containing protein [Agromyces marinus]|uniref:Concanavalin A-like lectin/glucanases superfamily protein n=1 Tax=Agromyces marinus TaxID=1389020 RepID=A0ABM8GX26_9MICO|nr:LamG domain-containing protein [Agromyces marinus]UIP58656.1 hypothetical protein DSM26151_15350 [Agromyces marinus]BDZ53051.1 hypothetical protein GCM10025870_01240 [Agromyces marinus]
MGSWLVARWRVLVPVAAVVVIALVATIALVVPGLTGSGESAAEQFDCTELEEASFDGAGAKARACDVEVEVTGVRTPWETSWALPDGNTRLEISSMPSRTNASGEWSDVDTSIVGTPGEGTLQVAAPVYPIELNAGGTAGQGAPLGSIERDGKRIDVWFPTELPVPEVDGTQVSYRLADGVRLVVSVNVDGTGFLPVVELADPAAAARFQALVDGARPDGFPGGPGDLVFSTEVSDGLRLVPEEQGSVLVLDDADEVHFVAAPPVMWDSAGGSTVLPDTVTEVSAGNRVAAPVDGDRIRMMDTTVVGSRIVITPDQAMLTSPDTVWPVYVDPSISGKGASEWVAVRTGGYTGTLYKWGDISSTMQGEGDGYCSSVSSCNTQFTQRLIWEFTGLSAITPLVGSNVISAGFNVNGVHSYSCTATTTDLHMVGGISASTTWSTWGMGSSNLISSRTEAHNATCLNRGFRTFDALKAARSVADNDWSSLVLALKARDESTMAGWKRFRHDATLTIVYNRPPNKPSSMQYADPAITTCGTGSSKALVNTVTPRLSAIVSDPDGGSVQPHFQVYTKSGTTETEVWNSTTMAGQTSGTRAYARVASGKLSNGKSYFWRVTSTDGQYWSGWGSSCEFTVDTSIPAAPTVTPVTSGTSGTGIEAVYPQDVLAGGVGLMGRFILGPAGSSDVVQYSYSFGDPATMTTVSVAKGATYEVSFDPSTSNAVTLYAKSKDSAGNSSPQREYRIKVASPVEDVIWKLDEGAGQSAADTGPKGAGSLTLAGDPGWVEGPHQLFGSREDDWALAFDGAGDAALSEGPVLDTRESFTVSAHVLLDETKAGQGDYTALSQDGLAQSGFGLGYRADCDGNGAECWAFGMPDTTSSSTVRYATSGVAVRAGEWVHLVGEHDATAKTLRLWVCEVGTPDRMATGEPFPGAAVTRGGSAWQAPGGFAVGRGQSAGAGTDWWPGQVDNVRLFSGQIVDASKVRRLCQGAEAEDFGQGAAAFNAVDPTVSEQ